MTPIDHPRPASRLAFIPILSLVLAIGALLIPSVMSMLRGGALPEPGDDSEFVALLAVPVVAFLGFVLALVAWRLKATPRWLTWLALAVNVLLAIAMMGLAGFAIGTFTRP